MDFVSDLYERWHSDDYLEGEEVSLTGWIKTNRNNGSIGFIEFTDGSAFNSLQVVYDKTMFDEFDFVAKQHTGAAIALTGVVIYTPDNKQPFEVRMESFTLVGDVKADYPLQKKRHSFDFLREISHLRPRTNTFNALFRVRSELSFAVHRFFNMYGFVYVHTPIITSNDAEGAGQTFNIVTDHKDPNHFFGKDVSLTVSGQLHVEAFAQAFRRVYTFGPTFRAEASNTTRHAAEFWMIEPEMSFCDLTENMVVIEECIKYCIDYVLENCPDEMEFFNTRIAPGLIERLTKVLNSDFKVMTYTAAIDILLDAQKTKGVKFEYNNIHWGMDLASEHERYICETYTSGPVFVTDYPKNIKAFYMRLNDDEKTVAACDLLVPGVGELVGGSQREDRLELLEKVMEKHGNAKDLQWYLDLRRYGGTPHAGFGIGFDRFLMYLTGMQNIRDVQPYARTFGNIKY